MAERRVATRPINTNAAEMADEALRHLTGGQPIREDQDELQKLWMDAYISAGGEYKDVDGGSSPDSACEPCPKYTTLTGTEVTFLSSHRLLKDEETEWTNTGALLTSPDWTPTHTQPMSHSMGESIAVGVHIDVEGLGAPETGRLVGKIEGKVYFESDEVLFSPGDTVQLGMVSAQTVIEQVREQTLEVVWRVWTDKSYREWHTLFTSSNRWFTTIGTPKKHTETTFGVTVKRMEAAVEFVGSFSNNDPVYIVQGMMTAMPDYTLEADPVAAPFGHPQYFAVKKGGAWAHLDHLSKNAECQAIVRLVQKLLFQIGAEGKAEIRYVYALPTAPSLALEDTPADSPFGTDKTFDSDNNTGVMLVDHRLRASHLGKDLPPSHHPLPGGGKAPGFNAFEACLRFEAPDGTVLYFPGAMGGAPKPDAQAVLDEAFQTMAFVRLAPVIHPTTGKELVGWNIIKILWDYQSDSATPPP